MTPIAQVREDVARPDEAPKRAVACWPLDLMSGGEGADTLYGGSGEDWIEARRYDNHAADYFEFTNGLGVGRSFPEGLIGEIQTALGLGATSWTAVDAKQKNYSWVNALEPLCSIRGCQPAWVAGQCCATGA